MKNHKVYQSIDCTKYPCKYREPPESMEENALSSTSLIFFVLFLESKGLKNIANKYAFFKSTRENVGNSSHVINKVIKVQII